MIMPLTVYFASQFALSTVAVPPCGGLAKFYNFSLQVSVVGDCTCECGPEETPNVAIAAASGSFIGGPDPDVVLGPCGIGQARIGCSPIAFGYGGAFDGNECAPAEEATGGNTTATAQVFCTAGPYTSPVQITQHTHKLVDGSPNPNDEDFCYNESNWAVAASFVDISCGGTAFAQFVVQPNPNGTNPVLTSIGSTGNRMIRGGGAVGTGGTWIPGGGVTMSDYGLYAPGFSLNGGANGEQQQNSAGIQGISGVWAASLMQTKRADLNGDGRFNSLDYTIIANLIGTSDPVLLAICDIDNNGQITNFDVSFFGAMLLIADDGIFGDMNGNGRVDCNDSSTAPGAFSSNITNTSYRFELDFDLDGDNDSVDQAAFAALTFIDIDFNNDGVFPSDDDVTDFFAVLSGAPCASCDSIDINGDEVFPQDEDVILFFAALSGGGCS